MTDGLITAWRELALIDGRLMEGHRPRPLEAEIDAEQLPAVQRIADEWEAAAAEDVTWQELLARAQAEPRVPEIARELKHVPVGYRDVGESHEADRTFDRCGRVSETSAEVERAGSAFGVPVSLPPGDGWVVGSATLLALVARLTG